MALCRYLIQVHISFIKTKISVVIFEDEGFLISRLNWISTTHVTFPLLQTRTNNRNPKKPPNPSVPETILLQTTRTTRRNERQTLLFLLHNSGTLCPADVRLVSYVLLSDFFSAVSRLSASGRSDEGSADMAGAGGGSIVKEDLLSCSLLARLCFFSLLCESCVQ